MSATDATEGGCRGREDDITLLARFVLHLSTVCSYLSAAGASQMHSRIPLRSYGRTRRLGYPRTSMPSSLGVTGIYIAPPQAHRCPLGRRGGTDRSVSLLSSSVGPTRTKPTPSHNRLEKAIANWKPDNGEPDPTTNFWTVYKKVAGEYDDEMVKRYVTDLDNSLLFVSAFPSPGSRVFVSTRFFRFRRHYFRPFLPHSLSKSSQDSSRTPLI